MNKQIQGNSSLFMNMPQAEKEAKLVKYMICFELFTQLQSVITTQEHKMDIVEI